MADARTRVGTAPLRPRRSAPALTLLALAAILAAGRLRAGTAGAPVALSAGTSALASAGEAPALLSPTAAIHVVGDTETAVYAAFITQAFTQGKADGPLARETILVENDAMDSWQPTRRAWENYLLKGTGGQGRAGDEAQKALLARFPAIVRFYAFPPLALPVRLVRSDVVEEIFKGSGWPGFYDAFPRVQGILTFSAIGFGAAGTEALFTARLGCGRLCGYRDLVFMRRVNGEWTLIMKDPLP